MNFCKLNPIYQDKENWQHLESMLRLSSCHCPQRISFRGWLFSLNIRFAKSKLWLQHNLQVLNSYYSFLYYFYTKLRFCVNIWEEKESQVICPPWLCLWDTSLVLPCQGWRFLSNGTNLLINYNCLFSTSLNILLSQNFIHIITFHLQP